MVVLDNALVVVDGVAISVVEVVAIVSAVLVTVTTVSSKVGALRTVIVMLLSIVRAVLLVMYALIKTGSRTMFCVSKTLVITRPEGHWSALRSMFKPIGFAIAGDKSSKDRRSGRIMLDI